MRGLIPLIVAHCQGLFKLSRLYLHKLSCTCAVMQTTSHTFVQDIHSFCIFLFSRRNTKRLTDRCPSPLSISPGLQCRGWCCRRSWRTWGWFWSPEEAPRHCGTSGTGAPGSPRSPGIAAPSTFPRWRPRGRCTEALQVSLHTHIDTHPSVTSFALFFCGCCSCAQGRGIGAAHFGCIEGVKVGSHPGKAASSALSHSTHAYGQ